MYTDFLPKLQYGVWQEEAWRENEGGGDKETSLKCETSYGGTQQYSRACKHLRDTENKIIK